jgi:hypothetical protein
MGKTYAEALEEVLGLLVDVESTRLGVLGEVESGDLGDVLVLALTLLLLKLEGDTADGTTLNTLHQVSGVSGDLVPQTLGGDDGDLSGALVPIVPCTARRGVPHLIANPLVGLEVERQLGVVTLDDDLGGLLDSLRADATHFGGFLRIWWEEESCELVENRVVVGCWRSVRKLP